MSASGPMPSQPFTNRPARRPLKHDILNRLYWRKVKAALAKKRVAKKRPKPFIMYDSVTIAAIPKTAGAVAGYVGGRWFTFPSLEKTFPKAKKLSIAISASEDAECLDIENGDATPDQAPEWARRQLKRGVKKPVVYCSVATVMTVLKALSDGGIRRNQVRLWTAHYTGRPHRCSPLCKFGMWTRADATQFTDKSLGRNLDASYCSGSFL